MLPNSTAPWSEATPDTGNFHTEPSFPLGCSISGFSSIVCGLWSTCGPHYELSLISTAEHILVLCRERISIDSRYTPQHPVLRIASFSFFVFRHLIGYDPPPPSPSLPPFLLARMTVYSQVFSQAAWPLWLGAWRGFRTG